MNTVLICFKKNNKMVETFSNCIVNKMINALMILTVVVLFGFTGNFIDTEPSYYDHPLLQSLDKYQFLSPLQYEDFHHEHRKNTITTELTNVSA